VILSAEVDNHDLEVFFMEFLNNLNNKKILKLDTEKVGTSYNASDLYSGGFRFKARLGHLSIFPWVSSVA
jgi:hypothetical protein